MNAPYGVPLNQQTSNGHYLYARDRLVDMQQIAAVAYFARLLRLMTPEQVDEMMGKVLDSAGDGDRR